MPRWDTRRRTGHAGSRRAAARQIVNPDLGRGRPSDAAAFMNSIGAWATTAPSTTGLDDVDLWVGGLAERTNLFGGLLGSTFNYVFENQLTDLQNGDRLYYLARTPGMNLRAQLEGNSFAEMMMRNTNAHTLKADAFATADCKFELKNLAGTPAGFAASGNTVADDPASECNETALLIRMPDGTIKYRAMNTVDPSGINGQSRLQRHRRRRPDLRRQRQRHLLGRPGQRHHRGRRRRRHRTRRRRRRHHHRPRRRRRPQGRSRQRRHRRRPGLDIIMGGDGKDFTNGGANTNETFAGEGDDFVIAGRGIDAVFGDSGDDWEEGGDQPDLLSGDSGNLFFLDDSQKPGHDILIGQGGDDDYDMEGGDDIGVARSRHREGRRSLRLRLGDRPSATPSRRTRTWTCRSRRWTSCQVGVRDRFNEVEALSGGISTTPSVVTTWFPAPSAAAASSAATCWTRPAWTGSPASTRWCRHSARLWLRSSGSQRRAAARF